MAQGGFSGTQPGALTDIWIPNMMFRAEGFRSPDSNWLQVWGRLASSVTRDSVRPILVTMLTNFETEGGLGVLRAAMSSASPVIRPQAAAGLRNVGPAAAPLVQRLLNDSDRSVRKVALRSAQALFTAATMPDAVGTRIAALSESDPEPFIRSLSKLMGGIQR